MIATELEEFNSGRGILEADTVVGTATAVFHIKSVEVDENSLSGKLLNLLFLFHFQ